MKKPALVLVALASSLVAIHCGGESPDCVEAKTCAEPGTDGGGGGDVTVPEGCDANADPKDAPKCVVNAFGIFVDGTNGNDANAGTRESPMKTINGALAKANGKPRVYICDGAYEEHVKLTTATSLYGGLACGSWTPSGVRVKVAPKDEGYALQISGVASALVISDLNPIAMPGTSTQPSSIAVFAANTAGIRFRRVEAEAGTGFKGAVGQTPVTGTPAPPNLSGNVGGTANGGDEKLCTCSTGGTSKGGRGGSTGLTNIDGALGEIAQVTPTPAQATGAGGTRTLCEGSGTGVGARGSDAPPAANGASPASAKVDPNGWQPGNGLSGENGKPGQGGGGGGSYTLDNTGAQNGGGGGGACGGCGGGGGGGGNAGGASIALLTLDSTVSVEASALIAGDAGDGGNGVDGATGQLGGLKGQPGNNACPGGAGGTGGKGGAGSGGSGGVSVGIVYKGLKPTMTDTTIATGAKGNKGLGGAGNDGADGVKADFFEVP